MHLTNADSKSMIMRIVDKLMDQTLEILLIARKNPRIFLLAINKRNFFFFEKYFQDRVDNLEQIDS